MIRSDIRICFFGDSFTAGIGDPEGLGWVGRVTSAAAACGHDVTAYNLGIRRETSGDILQRWQHECEPRTAAGAQMRVVLSFGANDTALDNGRPRLALEQSLANACTLLRETRAHHAALLIGPPPVADAAHDERIGALSRELAGVAAQESVPYLDVFTPLQASALWRQEVIANDGSHPRSGGYRELATLVMSWSAWWFHQPHSSTPQQGQAGPVIRAAETDREIDACFPVMKQLRPQLVRSEFVTRVRRQMADGYRLACLIEGGTTRCVAGYRLGENLAWGRFLYVDDLVTGESSRSHGHGRAMLAWLLERAREAGCQQLHLDSGMQRTGAHRFYVREGLDATSLHFARRL